MRLMGIKINGTVRKIILINVYLQYCYEENLPELYEVADTPLIFVIGDFNADTQSHQKFGTGIIT